MVSYLNEVIKHIEFDNYGYWFVDQLHMWRCLPSWQGHVTKMNDLKILDSDFIDGVSIWTGRGPRKFTDPTYMRVAAYYKDKFFGRR
jgi:hypothetical protein